MPIRKEDSDGMSQIYLDGDIDIVAAVEIKSILLDALGSGNELRVNLENATDLDVTSVQLLYAADRAASRAGIRFSFEHIPDSLSDSLMQAGLTVQSKL